MTTALTSSVRRGRRFSRSSMVPHLILVAMAAYFLLPLWWLIVASTKDANGLFYGTSGTLWFDQNFNLIENLQALFTRENGIYLRWMGNSALYALTGGVGATILAVLAGYGLAKYRFHGRRFALALLLGSVMIPHTALVIPTFMLLSQLGLTNTVWAVILPSLLNPFGVYLMMVYTKEAVPDELLDAARIDGAGEIRTFFTVALPLLRPVAITVLLLSVVATWNNYFLPLAVLSDANLFPLTVGIGLWEQMLVHGGGTGGGQFMWTVIITGCLVSIVPLVIAFLSLQRYWQGGLSLGSLK